MSKPTPGPWNWAPHVGGSACRLVSADGTHILTAEGADGKEFDDDLIAAAPDLLRELSELAESAHNVMDVPDSVWAAIAKARGE